MLAVLARSVCLFCQHLDACDQAALVPILGDPGLTYRVCPREQWGPSIWPSLLLPCPGSEWRLCQPQALLAGV